MLLSMSSSALAATITVNTTTDETGQSGHCSLRDAITAANSDTKQGGCLKGSGTDKVVVPAGHYVLSQGELSITSSMKLTGAGASTTKIDANKASRSFEIGTGGGPALTVAISGLTLTGGQAPDGADGTAVAAGGPGGDGGAILNHTATLSISTST